MGILVAARGGAGRRGSTIRKLTASSVGSTAPSARRDAAARPRSCLPSASVSNAPAACPSRPRAAPCHASRCTAGPARPWRWGRRARTRLAGGRLAVVRWVQFLGINRRLVLEGLRRAVWSLTGFYMPQAAVVEASRGAATRWLRPRLCRGARVLGVPFSLAVADDGVDGRGAGLDEPAARACCDGSEYKSPVWIGARWSRMAAATGPCRGRRASRAARRRRPSVLGSSVGRGVSPDFDRSCGFGAALRDTSRRPRVQQRPRRAEGWHRRRYHRLASSPASSTVVRRTSARRRWPPGAAPSALPFSSSPGRQGRAACNSSSTHRSHVLPAAAARWSGGLKCANSAAPSGSPPASRARLQVVRVGGAAEDRRFIREARRRDDPARRRCRLVGEEVAVVSDLVNAEHGQHLLVGSPNQAPD